MATWLLNLLIPVQDLPVNTYTSLTCCHLCKIYLSLPVQDLPVETNESYLSLPVQDLPVENCASLTCFYLY